MGTFADEDARSAGAALVKGDLSALLCARRLGYVIAQNIRKALFFAFADSGIAVPVAAGVLYPFFLSNSDANGNCGLDETFIGIGHCQ